MTSEFTNEQHRIWATLYGRQIDGVRAHACSEYLEGATILELPPDQIPSLENLNERITPRTGWRTVRTEVRYTDAVPWYQAFARREFLVTNYIRSLDDLDFTPEPDMFHDIFGHLPFMALPEYTGLQEMFAPAFERADDEGREHIKQLAWYSTEFGLKHEGDRLTIFGAGLISSFGEMENVLAGNVPVEPFTIENVLGREKAIYSYNDVLFSIESIEQLKEELERYFSQIR